MQTRKWFTLLMVAFLLVSPFAGVANVQAQSGPIEPSAVDETITIAEARALANGETATVQGSISAPIGVFRYDELWAQDATAGIDVFGVSPSGLQLGDIIEVTGEIAEYNGKKEIMPNDVSDIVLVNRGVPPAPVMTDTVNINENSEGWLVAIKGTVSGAGGSGFSLDDGSGATDIYIDSDTGIDSDWIQDGDMLTVLGISSQYDGSAPYDSGYQVTPRYQTDIAKGDVMPIALARQQSAGITAGFPLPPAHSPSAISSPSPAKSTSIMGRWRSLLPILSPKDSTAPSSLRFKPLATSAN